MFKPKGILAAIVLLRLCGLSAAAEVTLNQKIVAFCEKSKGEKVGDGQCAALATQALRHVGAKSRMADSPNADDYVWGKQVFLLEYTDGAVKATGKSADIQPGDIIQYRDVTFKGKTARGTYSASAPHHTAIVFKVANNGRQLTLLEQNSGGKMFVIESKQNLNDLKQGWIRVYRPIAAEPK